MDKATPVEPGLDPCEPVAVGETLSFDLSDAESLRRFVDSIRPEILARHEETRAERVRQGRVPVPRTTE